MTPTNPSADHQRHADHERQHQPGRDHWVERPSTWVGGACDRGVRHLRNDDAMALAAAAEPGTSAVLVVCDGVSTAPGSDAASLTTAEVIRDVMAEAAEGASSTPRDIDAWDATVVHAAQSAIDAIVASGTVPDGTDPPPSCTMATVVIDGPRLVVGWIGDSRVYWLPDSGEPLRLTVDDSWAQVMIEAGATPEEAESAPNAHAITRWLSADDSDHEPRRIPFEPEGPGWVLVCTDGLWNYASDPQAIAGVVRAAVHDIGPDPGDVAVRLVAWANAQGGRDNITAALARL